MHTYKTNLHLPECEVAKESMLGDVPKRRQGFTAMEIMEQVRIVQDWLAEGVRPSNIRQRCSESWGISTRTSEHRIQSARRQMIADINIMDRAEKVSEMLEKLETVIEQAINSRMGANAIGAMRLQADLLQLIQKRSK
jgi:hypothetical protein